MSHLPRVPRAGWGHELTVICTLSKKAWQPSDSNYLHYYVWPKEIKESRVDHSNGLYVKSGLMRTVEIPSG